MQVFAPFPEPITTALCLDQRRLHKQIIECYQILAAINGTSKAWANHPVVKMYRPYKAWLLFYYTTLICYANKSINAENILTKEEEESIRPPFLTDEFCNQHKRRLYTKDPEHYKEFQKYGKSDENWYFVDGQIVKYVNGKKI